MPKLYCVYYSSKFRNLKFRKTSRENQHTNMFQGLAKGLNHARCALAVQTLLPGCTSTTICKIMNLFQSILPTSYSINSVSMHCLHTATQSYKTSFAIKHNCLNNNIATIYKGAMWLSDKIAIKNKEWQNLKSFRRLTKPPI